MSILTPEEVQQCMTTARKVLGAGRDLEGCFAGAIEAALLKKLASASVDIKTWRERVSTGYESCDKHESMQSEVDELRVVLAYSEQERDELKAQLQEFNLQYISDFGQLQNALDELGREKQKVKDLIYVLKRAIIIQTGSPSNIIYPL